MLDKNKDFVISEEDKKVLLDLGETTHWKILKKTIEGYLLKLSANLLSGTEVERDSSIEELKALRGFVRFWSKLEKLIENKKDE